VVSSKSQSHKPGAPLNMDKRTKSQHKSTLKGLNPDTTAGWRLLRADASALQTVRDVDEMREEIESLPEPVTPARKSLLAVLGKRREFLTAEQPAQPQPARQQEPPEARPPEAAEARPPDAAEPDAAARERKRLVALQKEEIAKRRAFQGQQAATQQEEATRQREAATRQREAAARQREEEARRRQEEEAKQQLEVARQRLAETSRERSVKEAAVKRLNDQLHDVKAHPNQQETSPKKMEDDQKNLKDLQDEVMKLRSAEEKWQREVDWAREVEKTPAWDDLRAYADKIPSRGAGEKPHSIVTHLLQRLSDAENGRRPPVKVRRHGADGSISLEPVTRANYEAVMDAAVRYQWAGLSDGERTALQKLTDDWSGVDAGDKIVKNLVDEWISKLQFQGFEKDPDKDKYRGRIQAACKFILRWIDPAVIRETGGLPQIIIHGAQDKYYDANTRGNYEPEDQVIHLNDARFENGSLLLHEFGHHLEDQGPAEVWLSFATFLSHLADGSDLVAQADVEGAGMSAEPYYFRPKKDGTTKFTDPLYAPLYYGNGLTELLPLALEYNEPLFDRMRRTVNWKDEEDSEYYTDWMAAVLAALQPSRVHDAGVQFPTLLLDPPEQT
jgi:hypothetical protein